MKLNQLLKINSEQEIASIMLDSRQSLKNAIFFCVKGQSSDGHQYVKQASLNGAVCVVHSDPLDIIDPNVVYYQSNDVHATYVEVCHTFYHHVSDKLTMIAVTGTNGKTTIATMIQSLLSKQMVAGYIGTNGYEVNGIKKDTNLSTPPLHETLEILAEMVALGCKVCAIEVTSQGLYQGRVDGIHFNYTIYTNLTHDHLDYHGSFENYLLAKKLLFDHLGENSVAIVNQDDPYTPRMISDTKAKVLTYGIKNPSDYQATNLVLTNQMSTFDLITANQLVPIKTNLLVEFNVYNLLSVIALLAAMGRDIKQMVSEFEQINRVDGRLNMYQFNNTSVIVDYAHTPDGFEQLFQFVQGLKGQGRIISIFGAAGRRDKQKRPILGSIAAKYSDVIILTEEDNRNETPLKIAEEIKQGIPEIVDCRFEADRFEAIQLGLAMSKPCDIVLILGKGAETFLDRKEGRVAWISDNGAVEAIINRTV